MVEPSRPSRSNALLRAGLPQAADLVGEGETGAKLGGVSRETGSHPQRCRCGWVCGRRSHGAAGWRQPTERGKVFVWNPAGTAGAATAAVTAVSIRVAFTDVVSRDEDRGGNGFKYFRFLICITEKVNVVNVQVFWGHRTTEFKVGS